MEGERWLTEELWLVDNKLKTANYERELVGKDKDQMIIVGLVFLIFKL